jgi:hypothetical protein
VTMKSTWRYVVWCKFSDSSEMYTASIVRVEK